MPNYFVMTFTDWVNVLAITPEKQLVMVEQYRHAAARDFLEVPGGGADPGEAPLSAAARELVEETGYTSNQWISCGHHFPNPAMQTNRMHTFLALDCKKTHDPKLDAFEDLIPKTVPVADIYESWFSGQIQHSIISASLALGWRPLRERGILA